MRSDARDGRTSWSGTRPSCWRSRWSFSGSRAAIRARQPVRRAWLWRSWPRLPSEGGSGSTERYRRLDLGPSYRLRGGGLRALGGDDRRRRFLHWRLPICRSALEAMRQAQAANPLLKWGVYTCIRAIYGSAAGFARSRLRPSQPMATHDWSSRPSPPHSSPSRSISSSRHLQLSLRGGRCVLQFIRMCAPMVGVSICLYTPIVAALAVAYTRVSPWTLPLFFLPALAAQRLFGLYQEQRQLAEQLVDANADLEKANISFATASSRLSMPEIATRQATRRRSRSTLATSPIRMGLPDEETSKAHLAGLVHDIGKIGLSAGVLEKPGALTLDERREMQRHSEIGERILAKVDSYAEIASIVRHHHERVDGGGYPDGLTDDEIPLLSRIIAVTILLFLFFLLLLYTHEEIPCSPGSSPCRRIQRHDVRSTVSRCDAEPGCATTACAGCRHAV